MMILPPHNPCPPLSFFTIVYNFNPFIFFYLFLCFFLIPCDRREVAASCVCSCLGGRVWVPYDRGFTNVCSGGRGSVLFGSLCLFWLRENWVAVSFAQEVFDQLRESYLGVSIFALVLLTWEFDLESLLVQVSILVEREMVFDLLLSCDKREEESLCLESLWIKNFHIIHFNPYNLILIMFRSHASLV